MAIIESKIDIHSSQFAENQQAMLAAIESFRDIERKVYEYTQKAKAKFDQRGQLLPHDRLAHLLDRNSEFLELCSLAGYLMHDDKDGSLAGGGLIAGIGTVCKTRCLIIINNSAIKGGTISPAGLHKTLRLQTIAAQNKLPVITLLESGGANLTHASEVFVEGARGFANQARLSAQGIPQISVVHGNATAGGAYQPGLSDYVVMIKKRAHMFLAGPPLLKAATGDLADEETLGGAEMHTQIAGSAEYLAEDDAEGIHLAREIVRYLGWQNKKSCHPKTFAEPRYSTEELLGLVPTDAKTPYDVREVIARIADDSDFFDFKSEWDHYTVCGWLKIEGQTCGCIGNNGPITPQGAAKAAQFIQLCDQTQRPIIFLHNTTGFLVGTESEQQGVIKHGSKMLQAVANSKTPKITLVIGGSYGAGNYAMCGRGLDPHFIFAWPNSKTAVMGGAQAGKVLRIVAEQKQQKAGLTPDPKVLDLLEQTTQAQMEKQSTAIYGSARLWDDGLIDPRDSRKVLALTLNMIREAQTRKLQSNSFGVARF